MSLRSRILGLISLVLFASIAVGMLLTYWHAQKKVLVEMQAAIAVGTGAVREAVETVVRSAEHSRQLSRIVASFDGDRHLKARWIGPTGATMAESRLLLTGDRVPEWFYRIFAGAPHSATVALPSRISDLGQIRLESDSHNEVEEIWEDLALKSAIVVLFTALLLSLVYSALSHALKPLETLSSALIQVGSGDYATHVPEAGPLELATIYGEFNRMSERLAQSEKNNRRLNEQLSRVQEEERADIARDLHDEFGPFLFSIDVDARSIRSGSEEATREELGGTADAIRASVAHMQKHLKSILGRLRPNALLDLGLSHALDHLLDFWRSRHPTIFFKLTIDQSSYGQALDDVCYRIVQESISNAVRHGAPKSVNVCIGSITSKTLRVSITDDGDGLKPTASKGFGLDGMRERAASVGGTISVSAGPAGTGVQVLSDLPLNCRPAAGKTDYSFERTLPL